jgi:lysophospholipase
VTALDWRGQGGSQGAGFDLDSFDPLAGDFAAFLADWSAGTPGPHVAVGHSMGGHLLLRALVEGTAALDAAVLVAPMIVVNSAPIPSWLAPDIADTLSRLGFRKTPMWKAPPALQRPGSQRQRFLTGSRARYEDELWWWDRHPSWNLGAPSWGWLRAAFRSAAAAFPPERLARVALPVLLLGTERDRLVSPAAIRRVASQLANAELEMFPDSGHEILREEDSIRLAALARIDAFLDSHAR